MLDLQQLKLGHVSRRRREGADPETIYAELVAMGIDEDEAYEAVGMVAQTVNPKRSYDDWWIYLCIPVLLVAIGLISCAVIYGFHATLKGIAVTGVFSAFIGFCILGNYCRYRFYADAMPGNFDTDDSSKSDYITYVGAGLLFGGIVMFMLVGLTHREALPGFETFNGTLYHYEVNVEYE